MLGATSCDLVSVTMPHLRGFHLWKPLYAGNATQETYEMHLV
jgi:hypothetical protein